MSLWEVFIILAVALIVLGPEHLVKMARLFGKSAGFVRYWLDKAKKEVDLLISEERAKENEDR